MARLFLLKGEVGKIITVKQDTNGEYYATIGDVGGIAFRMDGDGYPSDTPNECIAKVQEARGKLTKLKSLKDYPVYVGYDEFEGRECVAIAPTQMLQTLCKAGEVDSGTFVTFGARGLFDLLSDIQVNESTGLTV